MHEINISVRNREANYISGKYICGNKDFTVVFDFDEEWDSAELKTARFVWGEEYKEQIFQGNTCPIPFISNTKGFHVGVYAGDLTTTTRAFVPAAKSILCGAGLPADPPPDVYAQILDLLNKGGASAEQIQNAVQDYLEKNPPQGVSDDHIRKVTEDLLNEAKENGEFDGKPGKDGEDGAPGKDGKDYILTEADKKEIADMVEGGGGGGNAVTDDHINDLIDAKLGVIENGTY